MEISLENLLNKYDAPDNHINDCLKLCIPRQECYIHLIQWFADNKVMPNTFDIMTYSNNHRFISYGNDLYGMYDWNKFKLFNPDGSIKDNFDGSRESLGQPKAIVKLNRSKWTDDKNFYDKYWLWKKNRNEKRAKLEAEFFYDTKNAMHLVRLLRMGYETLTTGQVNVFRDDASELLEIRNGSLTYDEILAYADTMDIKIKEAYDNTELSRKPNVKLAAQTIMEVQDLIWNSNDNNK